MANISSIPGPTNGISIFYSYAHEDEPLRKEFEKHLSNLRRQGLINNWHSRDISAGAEWAHEIDRHLNSAQIILLLISSDFMSSEYCYSIEMERAMARYEKRDASVIPILLRPVDCTDAPFSKLQILPKNGKPITKWRNRDEAFQNVVVEIRKVIDQLNTLTIVDAISSTGVASEEASKSVPPSPVWNIPYQRNPFFTGRRDVLRSLHEALTVSNIATLTQPQAISGLGGIGKTQTAIEYAYQYRHNYQAVLWIKADTYETMVTDILLIAELLNLPKQDAQDQNLSVEAVRRWLETHSHWLLIFDNANDPEIEIINDFLPPERKGHVLLTTRIYATEPFARCIEMEKMEEEEGALFLLRRANLIAKDASLDLACSTDSSQAKDLVRILGGLPLALDQAGAYIYETKCHLADYLHFYNTQRADLLKRRGRFRLDHPESVTTTWSLSFEKVEQTNAIAATLLRLCAFLSPDAIPEDLLLKGLLIIISVAKGSYMLNEAISELLKYSLARRNRDTKALSIHRLVQAVLIDSMDNDTQLQWIMRSIQVVDQAFPEIDIASWHLCQQYLPHALACAALIMQRNVECIEAAHLLKRTGDYLRSCAQYQEAEPFYQWSLKIIEQLNEPEHIEVVMSLDGLATIYYEQEKYEEAALLFDRALRIIEHIYASDHPNIVLILNNVAMLYREQGKFEKAESLFERALGVAQQILDPEHTNLASIMSGLAVLYHKQGRFEEATPLFERALRIYEAHLGPLHPQVAMSLNNLAALYHAQGKYEKAEPILERVLNICESGPKHPQVAMSLNNLATLYHEQGRFEEAEPLYQRALKIYEQLLGLEHPHVIEISENYAVLRAEIAQSRTQLS